LLLFGWAFGNQRQQALAVQRVAPQALAVVRMEVKIQF